MLSGGGHLDTSPTRFKANTRFANLGIDSHFKIQSEKYGNGVLPYLDTVEKN